MKLLLTSGGISNKTIAESLFDLAGKASEKTDIVFVPTASNIENGDKTWLINDLTNLKRQGFRSIDIADISAVPENIWRPKFESADVLFFEGGDTYYLMEWIRKSGLASLLLSFLGDKVYVGASAGSMVACKNLSAKISQIVYGDDFDKEDVPALGLVDFYFLPHLNSPYFINRNEKHMKEALGMLDEKIYALDDQSALKIVDDEMEVVGEGKWLEIN